MMQYIFSVTGISFLAGAIAVAVINRGKDEGSRNERWLKYFTYLAIVLITGASVITGQRYFLLMTGVVSIAGLFEIINVGIRSKASTGLLLGSMILYMLIASCFMGFAFSASSTEALSLYFIVILFDGFSQLSGQLWGRRKLAPVISPNKTIEGALVGFILTMLCMLVFFINEFNGKVSMIFLLISCPAALAGDLAASWYKRRTGVKDYNNLIPGHGGVLDRFDSFIAVGAAYFLFTFIFE